MKLNQSQAVAVGGLLGLLVVVLLIDGSPVSYLPMAVAAVLLVSLFFRRE